MKTLDQRKEEDFDGVMELSVERKIEKPASADHPLTLTLA